MGEKPKFAKDCFFEGKSYGIYGQSYKNMVYFSETPIMEIYKWMMSWEYPHVRKASHMVMSQCLAGCILRVG